MPDFLNNSTEHFSAGEGEILFGPLSFLEVVGLPKFEIFEGKELIIIHVKININLKAQKIEDMIQKRKQMHNASFDFLVNNIRQDILKIAEEGNAEGRLKKDKLNFRKGKGKEYTVDSLVENITQEVVKKQMEHRNYEAVDFLDNDLFRGLVIEMLDTDAMARSKILLYLKDESIYITDLFELSLSAAHRMRIALALKNLADTNMVEEGEKQRATEELCYLKGLIARHPTRKGNSCVSALIKAAANGLGSKDIKLLVDTGIGVDAVDGEGTTALFVAAQCGEVACIDTLVELKADVNQRNAAGRSPLFSAVMNGNLECVKKLVALNAVVNHTDKQGNNAFVVAAEAGHFDVVLYLKNCGATNSQNTLSEVKPTMFSALTVAVRKRQVEVMKFIVNELPSTEGTLLDPKEFEEFSAAAIKRVFGENLQQFSNNVIG